MSAITHQGVAGLEASASDCSNSSAVVLSMPSECSSTSRTESAVRRKVFFAMGLGILLLDNVVKVRGQEVVLVDATVGQHSVVVSGAGLILGKIGVVDHEELSRHGGLTVDITAVDESHTTVDGTAESQATIDNGEETGRDEVTQQSGVGSTVKGNLNSVDVHARNASVGIHHLVSDKHAQLVATHPTAVVLDDCVTKGFQRGAVAKSERTNGNGGLGDVVAAKLNGNAGQFTASDLIGSNEAATLTSLILGEVHRVAVDIRADEHVVVRARDGLVLEGGMQIPFERTIQIDEVSPLHAGLHLCVSTCRSCFLVSLLLCDCLAVQAGINPIADLAAHFRINSC